VELRVLRITLMRYLLGTTASGFLSGERESAAGLHFVLAAPDKLSKRSNPKSNHCAKEPHNARILLVRLK